MNRLSSGRLCEFAQALDVNFGYFFEGLQALAEPDVHERLKRELVRSFLAIADPRHQMALVAISGLIAADGVGGREGE